MMQMCANVTVNGNDVRNFTKEMYTKDKTLKGVTVASDNVKESRFSCVGNLYVCRGKPGKVSIAFQQTIILYLVS